MTNLLKHNMQKPIFLNAKSVTEELN